MTARLHHYVPQLYLRGFCQDPKRPRLFVVDAIEKRSFETSPRNVAAERDFNRVDIKGFAPDALEMDLAKFESDVSAALARISNSKSFRDPNDRMPVLNLLGLMALRNPRLREKFSDFQSRIAKMMLRLMLETPERWAAQIANAKADWLFESGCR
jgi:hypothetical protein